MRDHMHRILSVVFLGRFAHCLPLSFPSKNQDEAGRVKTERELACIVWKRKNKYICPLNSGNACDLNFPLKLRILSENGSAWQHMTVQISPHIEAAVKNNVIGSNEFWNVVQT